ncbi:MAG: LysR family transcriptional regulator [Nocardioides sp.]
MNLDLTAVESVIAASASTRRIQRLEAAVGVPLIERDTGGLVGLTPAGRRFLARDAGSAGLRPGPRASGRRRWRTGTYAHPTRDGQERASALASATRGPQELARSGSCRSSLHSPRATDLIVECRTTSTGIEGASRRSAMACGHP